MANPPPMTRGPERTVGIGIGTLLAVATICPLCALGAWSTQILSVARPFDLVYLAGIVAAIAVIPGLAFSIGYRFGPRLFSRTGSPRPTAPASSTNEAPAAAPQPTLDPRVVRFAPYMTTVGLGVLAGFILGPLGGFALVMVLENAASGASIMACVIVPAGLVSGPIFGAVGAVLAAFIAGLVSELVFRRQSTPFIYAAGLIGGGIAAFLAGLLIPLALLAIAQSALPPL